jgi:hypothetical protein
LPHFCDIVCPRNISSFLVSFIGRFFTVLVLPVEFLTYYWQITDFLHTDSEEGLIAGRNARNKSTFKDPRVVSFPIPGNTNNDNNYIYTVTSAYIQ